MNPKMKCFYSNGEVWEGSVDDCLKPHHYKSECKLHREDGPAVKYTDGDESYYCDGDLHNFDGPAIIHLGGAIKTYSIYGKYIEESTFIKIRQAKSREELVEYLLSSNSTIRILAEYTLKRLEY